VNTHGELRDDLLGDIDKVRHVTHGRTETTFDTVIEWEAQDRVEPFLSLPLDGEASSQWPVLQGYMPVSATRVIRIEG
jgi:hypothetical protein